MRKLLLVCLMFLASFAAAQQNAALMPMPSQPFLHAGAPIANGFVYTYQTGTLTPLATYTDATGTVQNSNPILLNAGGFPTCSGVQCGIWLSPAQSYRITVRNSANVQLSQTDGILGLATAGTVTTFCLHPIAVTLNAAVSTPQFPITCSFGAGALNVANKDIQITGTGTLTPVNTSEAVEFFVSPTTGMITLIASYTPAETKSYKWSLDGHCVFLADVNPVHCSGSLLVSDVGAAGTDVQSIPFSMVEGGIVLTNALTVGVGVEFTTASSSNSVTTNYLLIRQSN